MENNETIVTFDSEIDFGINLEMTEDELQHWGIKGMKWGQRRYQNPDGSLTEAGRKRYNQEVESLKAEKEKLEKRQKNLNAQKRMQARTDKLRADIDELKGKKKPAESEDSGEKTEKKGFRKLRAEKKDDKPKKPSEMTPEELREEIQRMRDIQTYNQLYSQLHPPKVNKGKETAEKFLKDAVLPAATNAAKKIGEEWMTKMGKEALGLNEKKVKTELEKLKEEYEKADYRNKTVKANKEREKLESGETDIADENRELENKIKNEKLKDKAYQDKQKESEMAKMDQTITNAKKGKSTEELLKDFLDSSNTTYNQDEIDKIKEKIDDGTFWAALNLS